MLQLNEKITDIIAEISEIALYLWQKGWAERNAGNISVNITEFIDEYIPNLNFSDICKLNNHLSYINDNYFIVSATNSRMRDLAKFPLKYLLLIKINRNSYSYINLDTTSNLKPTSELSTHLSVQNLIKKNGGSEKAVLHSHPNELIAVTHNSKYKDSENLSNLLWNMHPETMMFLPDGIGVVPYILPGSDELASKTWEYFEKYKLVVWEKHGCLAIGENITDSFDKIDTAVKSIDIYFKCRNAGFEPEGLTKEQIKELNDKFAV